MNSQVNVRFPDTLHQKAQQYADENGYGTLQDFIRETIRQKVYEQQLSREELKAVAALLQASKEKDLFATEKDLFDALKA